MVPVDFETLKRFETESVRWDGAEENRRLRETTEWTRTGATPLAIFMKFNFVNREFIVGVPALMQKLFALRRERVFPRFYRRLHCVCSSFHSSSLFLYPSLAEYLASIKIRLACPISGKPFMSCSNSQLVCNGFISRPGSSSGQRFYWLSSHRTVRGNVA